MAEFTRVRGGELHASFEEGEVELLRNLFDEMSRLLEAEDRKDPVTARLFPPAYDDAKDAESYRELIGDELKNSKVQALKTVSSRLDDEVTLPDEEIDTWLRVFADLRLAIGTRLDVTEETMDFEPDPRDPNAMALSILHWLGWVQESLLRAITS